ncbi:DUF3618 domain-containing protein [Pseudonocardia sp. TRM90224]|uniref:DUF3618 domain-containing protein n=1 Tax=Pseudonocardia sp. TRM90224 TaxID=2812678 RepID=UPI001E5E019A|nr:DUF3618 domain-containing protein [Pseudonocardia sp. TRM90224]
MTSTDDPERIRGDIERTRSALSNDVDALAGKVTPSRVVKRWTDTAKDAVMGTAQTIGSAPAIREQARGNPLAAGLIAFGTGLLLSSLLPSTTRERQVAAAAGDKAGALAQPVAKAAGDVAAELREPAQQAVESVRSTVSDTGGS